MATKNNEALKAANIMAAENAKAADKEREIVEQANRDALIAEQRKAFEAARARVIKQANLFGVQSARGEMSLTKLAFLFNDACRNRVMTVADAEVTYKAYVDARNAAVAAGHVTIDGVDYRVTADRIEPEQMDVSVSTFATFGKPAVIAQGLNLFQNIMAVQAEIPTDRRAVKSPYNAMVRVGRRIVKDCKASTLTDVQISMGEFPVTREYLFDTLSKTPVTKDFGAKLKALVDAAQKLVKAGDCPDLRVVFDALVIVQANYALANKTLDDAANAPAPMSTLVKADEIGASVH